MTQFFDSIFFFFPTISLHILNLLSELGVCNVGRHEVIRTYLKPNLVSFKIVTFFKEPICKMISPLDVIGFVFGFFCSF